MPARRPRAVGALGALGALVLAATLAGCSGDETDGPDDSGASGDSASSDTASDDAGEGTTGGIVPPDPDETDATDLPGSASTGETAPALEGAACAAQVSLTGAVEASWSADGVVGEGTESGAPAVYETQDGSLRLTLSAGSETFDPSVLLIDLSDGGLSFGSAPGEGDLAIAADGSGASVTAVLVAPELPGESVEVSADLTC